MVGALSLGLGTAVLKAEAETLNPEASRYCALNLERETTHVRQGHLRVELGRQVETLDFDHVTSSSPRGAISTTKIAVIKLICISVSRHFNDDLTNHLLT